MPPLTMRGRYIMREYWTDTALFTKLTAEQREVYVGLWSLSDDAGWLPRDISGIARALFGFEEPKPRESRVREAIERLRKLGKLTATRCCLHLPVIERYPRSGVKSFAHRDAHRTHRTASNAIDGSSMDNEPANPTLPDLTLPNPTLPNARARGRDATGLRPIGETVSEFRSKVPRPS